MIEAVDVLSKTFVAGCAIFGIYCIFKLVSDKIFAPARLCNAVIISSFDELDMLDEILGDASTSLYRHSGKKIVVFFSEELSGRIYENRRHTLEDEYRETLERYNAEWKIYIKS